MTKAPEDKNAELAELLPWYVNGTLDADTMAAIDDALETDGDLQRNLERALEDQSATLELAETDPIPASIGARFDAQLDQEIFATRRAESGSEQASAPGLLDRLGHWLQDSLLGGSRPRLAFAAAAAALIILLQSGAIVSLFVTGGAESGIDLASDDKAGDFSGIMYLVQIAPEAKVADLSAFLEAEGGKILEGPLPGDMYRLGFSAVEDRPADKIEQVLKSRSDLFALILPGK